MKSIYEKELLQLKPHDPVQLEVTTKTGYQFLFTQGHGYLVVPTTDPLFQTAKTLCNYGFPGKLACYLEEDFEAPTFLKLRS